MIGVVRVGVGNVASVHNMFRHLGVLTGDVTSAAGLKGLDAVVLPGVGSFDAGTSSLRAAGLFEPLRQWGRDGRPILGICLGMQLLCHGSAEGSTTGLGLVDAEVTALADHHPGAVIPNVGWREVDPVTHHRLFPAGQPMRFYFTHSYAVDSAPPDQCLATTDLAGRPFVSAIGHGATLGVQFHPEKSHRFGMALLQRFRAGL